MKSKKDLMMITLDRAIDMNLVTLATEGKSPQYTDWLRLRLGYFHDFLKMSKGEVIRLQEITVDDGRDYIRYLMERDTLDKNHPMHQQKSGKLKIQYIHGVIPWIFSSRRYNRSKSKKS